MGEIDNGSCHLNSFCSLEDFMVITSAIRTFIFFTELRVLLAKVQHSYSSCAVLNGSYKKNKYPKTDTCTVTPLVEMYGFYKLIHLLIRLG